MSHSTDIVTLARWMAADFSNQAQAFENPPFFAHIRVCMRPLPVEVLDGISLYLEQAYDIELHVPYRVRVLKLVPVGDRIDIENYAIENEEQFYGAARDPQRLQEIKKAQLTLLPGCSIYYAVDGQQLQRVCRTRKRLHGVKKGQKNLSRQRIRDRWRQIYQPRSRTRPRNRRPRLGSRGPFEFTRRASFADEIQV